MPPKYFTVNSLKEILTSDRTVEKEMVYCTHTGEKHFRAILLDENAYWKVFFSQSFLDAGGTSRVFAFPVEAREFGVTSRWVDK